MKKPKTDGIKLNTIATTKHSYFFLSNERHRHLYKIYVFIMNNKIHTKNSIEIFI